MSNEEHANEDAPRSHILKWSTVLGTMFAVYLVLWYTLSLAATKSLNVAELVSIDDGEGVEWVLGLHPDKGNDIGKIIVRSHQSRPFLDDYPAIMIAIRRGNAPMCKRLSNAGIEADSRFKDKLGRNLVHLAVLAPMPEIIDLAQGSSLLNAQDETPSGCTPMHLAVEMRNPAMVSLLVEHGADINALDRHDLPPISRVSADDDEFIGFMLHHGAAPCPALLYQCIAKHNVPAINRLLDGGISARVVYKGNPMWKALLSSDKPPGDAAARIIDLLLSKDMNVDSIDTDGNTALFYACRSGSLQVVTALLKSRPNLKWTDKRGATPLYIAAEHGHADVVKALYNALADKNTRLKMEHGGTTALHAAAANGHTEVVRFLAKHGAKLLVRSQSLQMPIHVAAANGHAESVRILVEEGNDVNEIVLGANKTVLDLAQASGNSELINWLKQKGGKTFKQIQAEEAERRRKLRE